VEDDDLRLLAPRLRRHDVLNRLVLGPDRILARPICRSCRLDPARRLVEIAHAKDMDQQMSESSTSRIASSRIAWQNVVTVLSAAVLIGAEVFGAAFAGGWALANLFGFGEYTPYAQLLLFLGGVAVMASFIRSAMKVEPFTL
jgi:hypothetical protein